MPPRLITPDSFSVAPQLVGQPLASPRRRAAAMAIDLLLVAVLIQLGGVVLGFTAAFVLWRMSGRGSGGGVVKRGLRTSLRVAAAILVFIVVGRYSMDLFRNHDDDNQAQAEEAAE